MFFLFVCLFNFLFSAAGGDRVQVFLKILGIEAFFHGSLIHRYEYGLILLLMEIERIFRDFIP